LFSISNSFTGMVCRMGPCISDAYQNKGLGTSLFKYLIGVAKEFEQEKLILWGGVYADNDRAIKYYEKNGFMKLGEFNDEQGRKSIDMAINIAI